LPLLGGALWLAAAPLAAQAPAPATPVAPTPAAAPAAPTAPAALRGSYVPHRVYDTKHKEFIDFEALAARAAAADLVFVGEQHDDPATHRMELALLEGIARRRDSVTVALEMFERDVQPLLDRYLAGQATEVEFLGGSRPWKNYLTDYRPLVELARHRSWPVVASDVPRSLASLVAKTGLPGLDTLPPDRRELVARALSCPEDDYYEKFVAVMGDMAGHGPQAGAEDPKARMGRMYQAQCVKDETMGESAARSWRPGRLVVHYNGAFHTDFRLGTAARARARAEGAKVIVVTAMPVKDLDALQPSKDDRKRADYLLYVLAPVKADSTAR
jgi:uncharacterized iron-regulated protein